MWVGNKPNKSGYCRIRVDGKLKMAHRHSWELCNGPIPADMFVLHKCDNPPCINPRHLFIGTRNDNNQDRKVKGRGHHPVGQLNHFCKITPGTVLSIKQALRCGVKQAYLASQYGISNQLVSAINRGRVWRHIQPN